MGMTKAAAKPDVRFIVRFTRDNQTLSDHKTLYTVALEAVYMGPDRYGPDPDAIRVRSPLWSDYPGEDEPVPHLADFTITGQAEQGGDWYGMGFAYRQPYHVG